MKNNNLEEIAAFLDMTGIPFTNICERDGGIAIVSYGKEWFIPSAENDIVISAIKEKATELRKTAYL